MPDHYKILFKTMLSAFLSMAQSDENLSPQEFDAVAEAVVRSMAVLPDMEERNG